MFVVVAAENPTRLLSDLPTPRLIEEWDSRRRPIQARLLPTSSKGNAIAYLADGTEPDEAKAYPVISVKLVWR